ncbi:peptidylprolyl isomerase [Pseudoalteromonas tunicata]|uniref:peptidylprolyl isomerase n=1 Tax=Pseudoalteromonas tunicata TaxID=314281 RepID=UPI00273F8C6D|nr:peptidylprolyl isomerase [Pseudoalteromonas tunicata]MDP4983690.1 peptidylprolyl isomerase [Pseudoalteromonas tunicata]
MRAMLFLVGFLSLPVWSITTQFTAEELALLTKRYQQYSPNISSSEVKQKLLEEQFLLAQANQYQPQLVVRLSDVGFSTDYHAKRYLIDLLINEITISEPTLSAKVIKTYNSLWLKNMLGTYPNTGELQTATRDKLKALNIKLGSFNFNFDEFYHSLSMQSRFKLHQGDHNYLLAEMKNWLRYQYLLTQKTALAKQGYQLDHLTDIATATIVSPSMRSYFGISDMMHSQSALLQELEQTLSESQLNQFYITHKEQFRYSSEVFATGAIFVDKQSADDFYQLVQKIGFANALKKMNYQDIFAQYHNRLTRNHSRTNWLIQSAFNLAANSLSTVIRSPDGQWVLIETGEKKQDYYSFDSETVRYLAKKSLAKQQALARYQQAKQQWLKAL